MRSALNVFAYAINKLDHDRWEAYYGLALAHWKLAERLVCDSRRRWYKEVDDLGDRACKLAPSQAAGDPIQKLKEEALRELVERRYNQVVDLGDRACKLTSNRDVRAQIQELEAKALRELDAARRRYNRVVDLCDRAGELTSTSRAARAQIQDLKAMALRELRALGKDDDPLSADLSDRALSACHR